MLQTNFSSSTFSPNYKLNLFQLWLWGKKETDVEPIFDYCRKWGFQFLIICAGPVLNIAKKIFMYKIHIKENPGNKYKLIFIHCQWLVKTNGVTSIFIEKLGNTFLPGQFWPCLCFASLSVPSGMGQSPDFSSCGPKLRPLYCCDMKLCGDGVGRQDLNRSRQLLSQLRLKHFNSKITS